MDRVAQVKGVLSAIKERGTEVMYAQGKEEARRITPTLVDAYKMCLSVLRGMDEYKDLIEVTPSLDANAGIETVVFAAEAVLALLRNEKKEKVRRVSVYDLSHSRPVRTRLEKGSFGITISAKGGKSSQKLAERVRKRLQSLMDAARDELDKEKDKWENEIELLENEVEKLQDRLQELEDRIEEREEWIEERVERVEERLEEKMESLEELLEELEEAEDDEDEDEGEDDKDVEDEEEAPEYKEGDDEEDEEDEDDEDEEDEDHEDEEDDAEDDDDDDDDDRCGEEPRKGNNPEDKGHPQGR